MKRKLLAVLLAGSMVFSLTACGSSDTADTAAAAGGTKAEQTVQEESGGQKFDGVKIELDVGEELREGVVLFQELVKRFCEETGADVEVVTNGNDHEAVMKTRMASQDMPDMWSTHGWGVLRYGEFAADLSNEAWVGRMEDSIKTVVTDKDGKIDTCPLTQWVYGIVFNKDVLEENGIDPYAIKTWDDLFEACAALKAAGITPLSLGTQGGSNMAGYLEISNAFYSIEGAPYRNTEALADGTFDWTANTHLLEKLAEMYDNGWFNEDVFTANTATAQKYLGTGEYGMMLWGSPAFVTTMKTYYPEGNFGIIPIPAVEEGGNAAYTVGEGTAIAISKDTEHMEVCTALLDYLTDPEILAEYINLEGSIPGFNDIVLDNTEIQDLYQLSIDKAGENIRYSNFFDREWLPSGMWNTMQETLVIIFNGEVGSAKDRVEEAAEYMQTNYEALLEATRN